MRQLVYFARPTINNFKHHQQTHKQDALLPQHEQHMHAYIRTTTAPTLATRNNTSDNKADLQREPRALQPTHTNDPGVHDTR